MAPASRPPSLAAIAIGCQLRVATAATDDWHPTIRLLFPSVTYCKSRMSVFDHCAPLPQRLHMVIRRVSRGFLRETDLRVFMVLKLPRAYRCRIS